MFFNGTQFMESDLNMATRRKKRFSKMMSLSTFIALFFMYFISPRNFKYFHKETKIS